MRRAIGQLYWTLQQARRLRPYRCGLLPTWRFLWAVIQKRNDDVRVCEFRLGGLSFGLRPRDWYAMQEVCLDDEYALLRALQSLPEPIRRIVDLGANVGLFSLRCFQYWPQAEIHAVEPALDTFALLQQNQARNPNLNWTVHQLAVCDREGSVPFDARALSTGSRLASAAAANAHVPATTLPGLLERIGDSTIDLLKMDIEGAEEAALAGAAECLRAVRHLIIELHPDACEAQRVLRVVRDRFARLYRTDGRASGKPLLLATDATLPLTPFDPARNVAAAGPERERSAITMET